MEFITLGAIAGAIALIVGIIKGLKYLYHEFVAWADKWLQRGLEPLITKQIEIEEKFENEIFELKEQLKDVKEDFNIEKQLTRKNELMRIFGLLQRDVQLDASEIKHLKKYYDEYTYDGGNSYIKDEYEKHKKAGKI